MSTSLSKVLCLLPEEQRPIIINGYLNEINRKKSIGEDLISLISLYYGDETFFWEIDGIDLKNLLDENNDETLKSGLFNIQNVYFYLELRKPEQQYVVLSVKILSQPKHSIMTVFARIFCEAPNLHKEYRDILEAPLSFEWDCDTLYLSEITELNINKVTFGCSMNILKLIQITDIDASKQKSVSAPIINYVKDITIKRVVNYTWNLKYMNQASCREYDSDKEIVVENYYSPLFENYDIICCHQNDGDSNVIILGLELTELPPRISEIKIKWDYFVDYDGLILKYWNNTYFTYCNKIEYGSPINCLEFVDDVEQFQVQKLSIKSQITILAINDEHSQEIIDKSLWQYYGIQNIKDDWMKGIILNEHDKSFKDKQDILITKIDKIENTLLSLSNQMEILISRLPQLPTNDNNIIIINNESAQKVLDWLNTLSFAQYYHLFINNGFDSISMIKEIKNKHDLQYIGVTIKAHQIKLINEINKL